MTTKNAVIITAVSVALIMAIIFGVVGVFTIKNIATKVEADVVSKIALREADYQKLIELANQRIQTLSVQVQACSSVSENIGNFENSDGIETQNKLTAQEALAFAFQAAGNDHVLSGTPKLVSFQGTPAFEIPFVDGIMYIEASSGSVLFSNVLSQINEQQAIDAMAGYLGVKNTSNAVVKKVSVDGTDSYKVIINNYVVYVDQYGAVTKLQVYHY